ncbi:NusB antitermination factor [Bifidobacterium bohemicum]|uniref:Transcription antitermination protein NusB n=1 Tax=Bifidobacterium bohemicum DSM 22767 TaxID=1437606 RepID=A0A086ZFW6_9BIFI|nr:transcription antitermination factor NusB [Bifidobacterium bohemicum DSM 22767]SCB73408.1 NusB antitermination factor [Bifidobacterium bohemicum]
MARSTARKRALNTLYEADEKGQDISSLLTERIAHPGAETPLPDYAIEMVRGVADELHGIDHALDEYSTKWSVRRMAVIDRNILRIAVWEVLFNDEVPDKVAIDEALSLAKDYSDDDAPSFVHGLLSTVSTKRNDVLTQIAEAREQARLREERRATEERRKNSPTAPGFLKSGGVSGQGDGAEDVNAAEGGDVDAEEKTSDGQLVFDPVVGQTGDVPIEPTGTEDRSIPNNSIIDDGASDESIGDDSVTGVSSFS